MAYNVFTWFCRKRPNFGSRQGFALVAVLLMAVLLTLVVVALFSLLNVETQSGGNVALRNQARQNALTGLDLAIGELQKKMGPDKRISTTSSYLDSDPTTEAIDGVNQAHWTGVWNAYKWNPANSGTPTTVNLPAYDKTTPTTVFQGWLVSAPTNINRLDYSLPKSPALTGTNSVILVSSGTVKPKASETVEVKVWKVDGDKDQAGFQGHYAWWVGDEGVKAKVNYPAPTPIASGTTPSAQEGIDLQTLLKSAPRNALEAATNYANLSASDPKAYAKALTPATLSLIYKNGATAGDFTKSFFDYTVYSQGVLSDVQNGGLKKDLNLLLELPKTNLPSYVRDAAGYKKIYYRTLAAQATTPATAQTDMGPDWGLIYRYYNLYKSSYLSYANGQYTFYIDRYNVEIAAASATAPTASMDANRDFILPQTLKVQYLFGFYKGPPKPYEKQYSSPTVVTPPTSAVLYVTAYPTLQLWNPYNIQLRTSTLAERNANPPPAAVGGSLAAQIWSFPSPPLSLSFDSGSTWRPFIASTGAATDSIFQSYGGSMCTNWIMSSTGKDGSSGRNLFFQLVMDPGSIRLFGIANFTEQQMYWQDQVNVGSSPLTDASPKRAFDLLDVWTSSNVPPHSDFLSGTGDHHIAASGTVSYKVKWNLDSPSLGKDALGRALFYEGSQFNRMPGVTELNTVNMKTVFSSDTANTYKIFSSDSYPAVSPSSNIQSPNMAFSYSISCKAYPKDIVRKSKASLFSDPLDRNYLLLGGDALAAQMSPYEITLKAIQGSASSTISNVDDGTKAVQVDSTTQRGYFGDQSDNVNSYVALEFPTLPMSSLSQLQNVALGRDYTHPMYQVSDFFSGVSSTTNRWNTLGAAFFRVVGNSYAHPAIAPTSIVGTGGQIRSFDHPFYANNMFWDSYFLSGITQQNTGAAFTASGVTGRSIGKVLQDFVSLDPTVYKALPANRLVPYLPSKKISDDLINDLVTGPSTASPVIKDSAFARSAAWLLVDGAFNINSTSVDAWVTVLSGLKGQQVPYVLTSAATALDGTSTWQFKVANTPLADIPFLRMTLPNNVAAQISTPQTYWNGYRKLTTADIQNLAQKIVEQVKRRGPFLSLAEFVNRQVSSDTTLSQSGALQTAIDKAGLNSDLSSLQVTDADLTSVSAINKEAAKGDMAAGTINYLTQADVLKPISGIISARSDTFTIRAYGEVTSPSGKVVSRAWCEAIVQRTPEFVDQTDPALTSTTVDPVAGSNAGNATPISLVNSVNQLLGRRFKIIQFRWLNSDEV